MSQIPEKQPHHRRKHVATTAIFLFTLGALLLVNLLTPAQSLSYSERRTLLSFDGLKVETLLTGGFSEAFDKIALDQFSGRDGFRCVKSELAFRLFNKRDSNGIAIVDGQIVKSDYPLDPKKLYQFNTYMTQFYDRFLTESRVSLAIIPDKSHYLKDQSQVLSLDFDAIAAFVTDALPQMNPIDLSDSLSLVDYYRTDAHWRQESLGNVLAALKTGLAMTSDFDLSTYQRQVFSPFYGGYYGQAALPVTPDELTYLSSDQLAQIKVTHYNDQLKPVVSTGVYDTEKLGKMDSYDVFLSGASPIVTLENPNSATEKELIIIRDSFGSSLAPLLTPEYAKITLVDLRYIHQDLLSTYVDFDNKEVLVLLSTSLIHSNIWGH